MIIKSDVTTWVETIIIFLAYWILGIKFLSDGLIPLKFIIFYLIICSYIFICWVISVGKTIIMNENGCTLKLWQYKKIYTWIELKEKYIENCKSYTTSDPYSVTVIFSIKKLNKSKTMLPTTYNIFFHPFSFSFFYVYFKVKDMHWESLIPYPEIYPVDEKEFLDKMQEWGIELEIYNAREERFR